jgi:hypothetical protein
MPNPIAATPDAATTIPKINNNTAIRLRPARHAARRNSPTARSLQGAGPTSTRRPIWLPNTFDPIRRHLQ